MTINPTSPSRFQEALEMLNQIVKVWNNTNWLGRGPKLHDQDVASIRESLQRTIAAEKARDGVDKIRAALDLAVSGSWFPEDYKVFSDAYDHLAALGMIGQKDDPWQTIETAPDGKNILVAVHISGSDGKYFEPEIAYRNGEYWFREPGQRMFARPDIWMPLPAAPAPSKEENK